MASRHTAHSQTLKQGVLATTGASCDYEMTSLGEGDFERLYATCQRHPNHEDFIPISSLTKDSLPEGSRLDELVTLIQTLASLTTRLVVKTVSPLRPPTWPSTPEVPYPCFDIPSGESVIRAGTGFVESIQKMFTPVRGKCPCPECVASGIPKDEWWEVRVNTATHLVFDDVEASRTTVDCFLDNSDTSWYHRLYGSRVCENPRRIEHDRCILVCVTHDTFLGPFIEQTTPYVQRLQRKWSRRVESFFRNHTLIISHPHGIATKCITIGRIHHMTVPVGLSYPVDQPLPFPPGITYRLPLSSSSNSPDTHSSITHMLEPIHTDSSTILDTSQISDVHSTQSYSESEESSQCLNENLSPLSKKSNNSGTCNSFTEELPLPPDTTFTLPSDASFSRKYSLHSANCFQFPSGTRLTLSDGREMNMPGGTQFLGWPLQDMVVSVSYSTPTCPGSSGAGVWTLEPRRLQYNAHRSLALDAFFHCRAISRTFGQSGRNLFINSQPNELMKDADISCVGRAKA